MNAIDAVPYVVRSVAWRVEVAYLGLAVGVIVHGRLADAASWSYASRLTVSSALVAASAGLVLDDAAGSTSEAAPRHRRVVVIGRTITIIGFASLGWAACVVAIPGRLPTPVLESLSVQALAWLAAGLLVARCIGAAAVTVSLLTTAVGIQFLPSRWAMVSAPGAHNWHDVQARWLALAAILAVALTWAFRDRAARPLLALRSADTTQALEPGG